LQRREGGGGDEEGVAVAPRVEGESGEERSVAEVEEGAPRRAVPRRDSSDERDARLRRAEQQRAEAEDGVDAARVVRVVRRDHGAAAGEGDEDARGHGAQVEAAARGVRPRARGLERAVDEGGARHGDEEGGGHGHDVEVEDGAESRVARGEEAPRGGARGEARRVEVGRAPVARGDGRDHVHNNTKTSLARV
jgi:hypothetical protein